MKYISSFKKYILISAVSILGLSSNVYAQGNLINKDSIKEVSFQDSVPEELKLLWDKGIKKIFKPSSTLMALSKLSSL